MKKLFTEHPASVGETYGEHLVSALSFSAAMARAAFCCCVHAFLPFLFETTGKRTISELHTRMVTDRAGEKARRQDAAGLPIEKPTV